MINAEDFLDPTAAAGFTFWTGVPCSFLTPFINSVIDSPTLDYVGATSEGEAIAIAIGAQLAGRKSVSICQNSGLGNTVNPLTSLNWTFRIPLLLITTHRGAPGVQDEPQHELMGQITTDLLEAMRIPWSWFPTEKHLCEKLVAEAEASMANTGLPFALVMSKGAVAHKDLESKPVSDRPSAARPEGSFQVANEQRMSRSQAIDVARRHLGDSALVATTGKIGRELFSLGHKPNQFYVVGGMGCASGIGLGIALGIRGRRRVAVLDGDGAALMKLGTWATIGHYQPARFVHIVLDNESHESTGGQATVSATTDLAAVAMACGYQRAWRVDTLEALEESLAAARTVDGSVLVHVKVKRGSVPNLGRPTMSPVEVKNQFTAWLQGELDR